MADLLKVRYGTETQLPATRDEFTLYFTTDTKKIFKGDDEYTSKIYDIEVGSETQAQGQRTITLKFKDGTPDATINILNAQAQTAILGILRGTATNTDKGLVTLSDAINGTANAASGGTAATPKAVADALEEAKNYADEQIAAGFSANDAMVFKGTIGSNGVIASSDETIDGKNISSITTYSAGWTFRVSVAINGLQLPSMPSGTTVNVEAGDMVVAINDSGSTLTSGNWSIVQANIHGAITLGADSLTQNALVLGAGTSTVKPLANGSAGQVLTMNNGTPKWMALPAEQDTTYTFTSGTTGNFTVTPSGGSAQTVSIGKPSTAGTADKVAKKLSVSISSSNMISTTAKTFDGSTAVSIGFGAAAAKSVSTTVEDSTNLVTAAAVYDALLWKSFTE